MPKEKLAKENAAQSRPITSVPCASCSIRRSQNSRLALCLFNRMPNTQTVVRCFLFSLRCSARSQGAGAPFCAVVLIVDFLFSNLNAELVFNSKFQKPFERAEQRKEKLGGVLSMFERLSSGFHGAQRQTRVLRTPVLMRSTGTRQRRLAMGCPFLRPFFWTSKKGTKETVEENLLKLKMFFKTKQPLGLNLFSNSFKPDKQLLIFDLHKPPLPPVNWLVCARYIAALTKRRQALQPA